MKAQRTICLGLLIGGERPEACIGCPIQTVAANFTDNVAQSSVVPQGANDTLDSLQEIYEAAHDPNNRQTLLANQIIEHATNIGIDELVKTRISVTECPQYSNPNP